ncbi:MAG: hypothetical protein ABJE00_06510 [Erythrobacter sp.]
MPIATLRDMPFGSLNHYMDRDFRTALEWHMDRDGTTIADLSRKTGVSRDIINKLLGRGREVKKKSSTAVENAILIAAYYGKTVEQFINMDEGASVSRLRSLAEMLSSDEAELLEIQARAILQRRGVQVSG